MINQEDYPRHEKGHIVFISPNSGSIVYLDYDDISTYSMYSHSWEPEAFCHIECKPVGNIISKNVIRAPKYRLLKIFAEAIEYKQRTEDK